MYNPQYVPCPERSDGVAAVFLIPSPRLSPSLHSNKSVLGAGSGPSLPNWGNVNVSNTVGKEEFSRVYFASVLRKKDDVYNNNNKTGFLTVAMRGKEQHNRKKKFNLTMMNCFTQVKFKGIAD